MTRTRKRLVLVLSAGFVWGTFALLLKRERQQSNVNFEESIPTPSLNTNNRTTNNLSLVDSQIGMTQLSGRLLEEKYELLFTYSELISFGTESPLLPRPRCLDDVEIPVLKNYTSLSQYLKKTAELSDVVKSVTASSRGFYVAALLRNSCKLASHFALEMIKLVLILGAGKRGHVFISVLESGSTDCSKQVISLLKEILDMSSVPNNIRFGMPSPQGGGTRVDLLQSLRNEVLSDLYSSSHEYDEVVYLNDVYFCASDILRLLRHGSADIKCGLDMETIGNKPEFYDTWVARDMAGKPFSKEFPFVSDPASAEAVKKRLPFQVTSCWNGLAVLKAEAFAKGVRFRRSISSDECHASECEIICHDFAALGFSRVLVDPNVLVSYDAKTFESLELVSGQVGRDDFNLRIVSRESVATLEVFRDRPACSVCIPLDGSKGRDPDHSKTYWFNWLSHYQLLGVPVANTPNVTSLHDCTDTFAKSCDLSRGKRVAPALWNASVC